MTPTKSTAVARQFVDTMQLFDLNSLEKSFRTLQGQLLPSVVCYRKSVSSTTKKLLLSKQLFSGKARQVETSLLRKLDRATDVIFETPNDIEGQNNARRNACGGKVLAQTLKRAKKSKKAAKDSKLPKDATKESNCTKNLSSYHKSQL